MRFMKNWKSRLFGDNHINFYGWCVAGVVVLGGSLWYVKRAVNIGATGTSDGLLLIAIYFVLLGHFAIALHNYVASLARKLEADDERR